MNNLPEEFTEKELQEIATEFQRVDGQHYLDHAGATLYSEKQIDSISTVLKQNLYSNPHTNKATADLIDQVRYKILKHFNVDITAYSVIFTSGATASLKLIAESFDFQLTGNFSYVQENHTSVLGMRDVVNTDQVFVLTQEEFLKNSITNDSIDKKDHNFIDNSNSLITFPAQCNFNGFKYPLNTINNIHQNGLIEIGKPLRKNITNDIRKLTNWYTCLDAASFVSTNFLDLSKYSADFVCLSFYKIFGYPTGLGALIVSKRGERVLCRKKYFGGGTVKIAMSGVDFHEKRHNFYEQFEDGTLPFLSIIALLSGFNTIERLISPTQNLSTFERIGKYVYELGKYCFESLSKLQHENGRKLVKFYHSKKFASISNQGGIVTFNLLHNDGSFIGFAEVACIAKIYNIHLRTGCFCNPGACQIQLGLSNAEIQQHYKHGHICGDYNDLIDGIPTGAIRISFGYMSTKSDIDAFIYMLNDCYTKSNVETRLNLLRKSDIPSEFKDIPDRIRKYVKKISLKEICIYPIKSCGPFKTKNQWELTSKGFKYDRCWMIVNSSGVAITQKLQPKLCLITPHLDVSRNIMTLSFLENNIEIPLEMQSNRIISSSLCQSKVCGDLIEGNDCGDEIAEWLSNCLTMKGIRLIYKNDDIERRNPDGSIKKINLANQGQFLLINYTSVDWLASKLYQWKDFNLNDLDGIVDRFRANLIIETTEPLDELHFKTIQIGNIHFRIDGPCQRCEMICIDQKTSFKSPEILRTIAKEFQGKIRFGIYLSQMYKNTKNNCISCKDQIFVE